MRRPWCHAAEAPGAVAAPLAEGLGRWVEPGVGRSSAGRPSSAPSSWADSTGFTFMGVFWSPPEAVVPRVTTVPSTAASRAPA